MLKNIITQYQPTLSIFLHRLWQALGLLSASMLVVSLWTLMILFLVSSLAIWLLGVMSLKGLALVSMLAELGELIVVSVAAKFNTPALSHSLKSLKQRSSVVHKMVLEEGQRLYTFLSGTKK